MPATRVLILVAALVFSSCVADRYRFNSTHAVVDKRLHLTPADYDRIVQLVSAATRQPMLAISWADKQHDSSRLSVFTGWAGGNGPQYFTDFELRKLRESWHIVDRGPISPFVISMVLNNG